MMNQLVEDWSWWWKILKPRLCDVRMRPISSASRGSGSIVRG